MLGRVSENGSGVQYSASHFAASLAAAGHDVDLSSLQPLSVPGVRVEVHPPWSLLSRLAVSPGQIQHIRRLASEADVVHSHGLWSLGNIASGWMTRRRHAALVSSPHGSLAPWAMAYSRHVKRMVGPFQWRALDRADLFHAASELEAGHIREAGFTAPIAVVPHGVEIPPLPTVPPQRQGRTLLFLSRIHPIKGLARLFEAWRALQVSHADWRLVVAGYGRPAHVADSRDLVRRLQLERVALIGPVHGAAKTRLLFQADLLVLPTHSESFGLVIAEALAHGCPVVVTKGTPWRGVADYQCGWWTSNDTDALTATLDTAMSTPAEGLAEMGQRGRDWMSRDFTWDSVVARMIEAYEWALARRDRPQGCYDRHTS